MIDAGHKADTCSNAKGIKRDVLECFVLEVLGDVSVAVTAGMLDWALDAAPWRTWSGVPSQPSVWPHNRPIPAVPNFPPHVSFNPK